MRVLAGIQAAKFGTEIDEFVTRRCATTSLGLPHDLAAINIARGHDTEWRRSTWYANQDFSQIGDSNLKPCASWAELGQFLKHAASLIDAVAAYGSSGRRAWRTSARQPCSW